MRTSSELAALSIAHTTLSAELQAALERESSVDVIINLREPYSAGRVQRAQAIASRRARCKAQLGGELEHARTYRYTPALAGKLSRAGVLRLEGHPDVASVQIDHRGKAQLTEAVVAVQAAAVAAGGVSVARVGSVESRAEAAVLLKRQTPAQRITMRRPARA